MEVCLSSSYPSTWYFNWDFSPARRKEKREWRTEVRKGMNHEEVGGGGSGECAAPGVHLHLSGYAVQ